ncbi:DUF6233 domain-containing protein (plasmid) [Streptomyces sp. NBC_01591]|uniref:DUF6233 domain-containing protein n=1 Tax=Streptomyces sp. NBC_01591 TaxID=2975888 RepID=UPI002DDAC595|nr:DUF6233 domain-containing protein [Streptomyces sp. NBC_01591]WSD74632.1 DUF6233 domain-containing protein [Streptomyces sp. NBC_01591]
MTLEACLPASSPCDRHRGRRGRVAGDQQWSPATRPQWGARRAIRIREVKEQQEARARERARADQSWKTQPQRSGKTALLHRGRCGLYSAQLGFLNREDALIALAEPDIEPCEVCRPETGLVQAPVRPKITDGVE